MKNVKMIAKVNVNKNTSGMESHSNHKRHFGLVIIIINVKIKSWSG